MKTTQDSRAAPLELWGGVECTIARIGDDYRDEAAETGHRGRASDVGRIAAMGIHTVRYPILWESIASDDGGRLDFSWHDERLAQLRAAGISVIGGLLHHGSGPRYTSLLDPDFPAKFADFAGAVAVRYPWIGTWTPINEPLTTARFSGLYGHWYPHRSDEAAFLTALTNECLGTLEAMKAIRTHIPNARLLQTEDLGKTFSTAPLAYQAQYENDRRWLAFDLLCGRVGPGHAFHQRMLDAGVGREALDRLAAGEAAPDMLGINHYLTSERFLDHRIHLYPELDCGGNGRDAYADAEAIRVKRLHLKTGLAARLREAWRRYGIPMAVTEVHHGCTRDEQVRWFAECWESANALRAEGMDLRAITLWSLFGNVDWRSLLTRRDGIYDVGAFDIRSPDPRPTLVAKAAKAYAHSETFDHPVLDTPGWWRRPERLYHWNDRCRPRGDPARKLLITGATGTLGQAFARLCEHRGLAYCLTDRAGLDITDPASIEGALARHRPWAVINAAGFVRVTDAEREQDSCFAANAAGPEHLARAAAGAGIPLVTFSSDLVFDGRKGGAYEEADSPSPASVYGRSKAAAERQVAALHPGALIVRTSAFFGPWDRYNFAWHVLDTLSRGEPVYACRKTVISPTFVPDLVHATLDLLIDGESGIWHLANQGAMSWHAFACRLAEGAGLDTGLIRAADNANASDTRLVSARGTIMRPLDHAIDAYLAEIVPTLEVAPYMDIAAE